MAYFKKECPKTPFWLSNGHKIQFTNIVVGNFGFAEINNPDTVNDIRAAMANSIGGFTEITKAEYEDGVKKKESTKTSLKPWREELSPQAPPPSTSLPLNRAVPVDIDNPFNELAQSEPPKTVQAKPVATKRTK
jgi:hypothetical protein